MQNEKITFFEKDVHRNGMNLFYFDKRRSISFVKFLMVFLLPFLLVRLGGFFLIIFFFPALLFINIVGILFGWTGLFDFQEFGAMPYGVPGWIVVILFYLAVSLLLSGMGSSSKKEKANL